jgi:hypothetical protein
MLTLVRASFCEYGLQYTATITKGVQITDSMESRVLKAWDLSDYQSRLGDADVDERLDFEAVAPKLTVTLRAWRRCGVQAENRQVAPPEDIEPITQI